MIAALPARFLAVMVAAMSVGMAAPEVVEVGVNYAEPGPCATRSWQATLQLPRDLHATLASTLPLNITTPVCANGFPTAAPFPVLIFFNGFQVRLSGRRPPLLLATPNVGNLWLPYCSSTAGSCARRPPVPCAPLELCQSSHLHGPASRHFPCRGWIYNRQTWHWNPPQTAAVPARPGVPILCQPPL